MHPHLVAHAILHLIEALTPQLAVFRIGIRAKVRQISAQPCTHYKRDHCVALQRQGSTHTQQHDPQWNYESHVSSCWAANVTGACAFSMCGCKGRAGLSGASSAACWCAFSFSAPSCAAPPAQQVGPACVHERACHKLLVVHDVFLG